MAECKHCGLPVVRESRAHERAGFCCVGCRAAHALLHARGLERFYELRGRNGSPVSSVSRIRAEWFLSAPRDAHLAFQVQGISCSACVWAIEAVFERNGGGAIEINPARGTARARFAADFNRAGFIDDLAVLGYSVGPLASRERRQEDGLLIRLAITTVLAMNGTLFAVATYLGAEGSSMAALLHRLSYVLAVFAVLVGAPVFPSSAIRHLGRGHVDLDLPVALGIGLSFFGASFAFWTTGEAQYADTLSAFIALMLLGRWLRARAVARNRAALLDDPPLAQFKCRVITAGRVSLRACDSLEPNDALLLRRGDLVPVRCRAERDAWVTQEWITGESEPVHVQASAQIAAGSFYVDERSQTAIVLERFDHSDVARLIRYTPPSRRTARFALLARAWSIAVLVVSGVAAVMWWRIAGALEALQVTTAVLVVTCPCAIGLAFPMAYEFAYASLRRVGVFTRDPDLLDHARRVKNIVFDKTGTLTTRCPRLVPDSALDHVDPDVLLTLAMGSDHPKSRAAKAHAEEQGGVPLGVSVKEHPGRGVEALVDGRLVRLGAPRWVDPTGACDAADLAFSDRQRFVPLMTTEALRPGARAAIRSLQDRGARVIILSGDQPRRVDHIAELLGVAQGDAFGAMSPDDKLSFLSERLDPSETMMIGDGLNDTGALAAAACSGTPSIDRPFVATKCSFYYTTSDLFGIPEILETTDRHARALLAITIFAVAYNCVAIPLALSGAMAPWLAAVLMPSSSIISLMLARLAGPRASRSHRWLARMWGGEPRRETQLHTSEA